MTTSEKATVLAWHDALNARDLGTLVELSSDDIEVGDAHGAVQGHAALREWASGVTSTVTVGRLFIRDGVVVAEEQIAGGDGAPRGSASSFRVVHDKVTSVFRHDDLASALAATELTEDDLTG
jgi:ketosteroid isomerase-like protein